MFLSDLSSRIFWDILAVGIVLINAFFVGSALLASVVDVETENPGFDLAEWVFLGTTLGLGLIAWITFPLGLILPYSPLLYQCGHAVVFVGGVLWWCRSERAKKIRILASPRWTGTPLIEKALWLTLGLTALYAIFLSLHSIGGSDGQTLHLKAVMLWQNNHHYVPQVGLYDGLPHSVGDEQTQSGRMLLLNVSLLSSVFATGAFNILLLLLGCLGVYALGCRWFDRRTAVFGVLIFLSSPVIFRYYFWDVTDYPLNLDVFLALAVALTVVLRSAQQRWLTVAAVLAGMLYGIKAYAVLQLALLGVIVLPFLYRRRWIGAAIKLSPLVLLLAAPWLLHHWIVFGNPLWPHADHVLAGRPPSAFWKLFTGTRPYFQLQRYFESGSPTYQTALWRFWQDQLFPSRKYLFAFSFLFVPSIIAFALGAWRWRLLVLPLVFAGGFLAVTLSTPQLFNKYMILVAAPTAPFLAYLIGKLLRHEMLRSFLSVAVGLYVLLTAWDAFALYNGNGEIFTHGATVRAHEPQQTLNRLPAGSVVFGNFVFMDNRYTRTYWNFSYLSDTTELYCDDWSQLWAFYQKRGITHYLVQTGEGDEFFCAPILPWVEKFDPQLAEFIRERQVTFTHNKEKRNQYLAAHGHLTALGGGYLLYDLR